MADDLQEPASPDPSEIARDPEGLKRSHQRYGNYLKKAGLPFEPEEFDEEADAPAAADDSDAKEPE